MPTATALSWQVKRVLGAALLFPGARQAGKMKIRRDGGWIGSGAVPAVSERAGLLLESRSLPGDAEGPWGHGGCPAECPVTEPRREVPPTLYRAGLSLSPCSSSCLCSLTPLPSVSGENGVIYSSVYLSWPG